MNVININNVSQIGNLIEAVLWLVVALLFFIQFSQSQGRLRQVFLILSLTFIVFGISDVIESQTGTWWQPLWLLLMKAGCILVFIFEFREYYRIKNEKI